MLDTRSHKINHLYPVNSTPPLQGSTNAAKSAVTAEEIQNRLIQLLFGKIGPKRFGEIKFRICGLPQKKIGDAGIAARSDDEIGISRFRGVHRGSEIRLGDRALPRRHQPIASASDLIAAAVIQRDIQGQGILCGQILEALCFFPKLLLQNGDVSDEAVSDSVDLRIPRRLVKIPIQKMHDRIHLSLGS